MKQIIYSVSIILLTVGCAQSSMPIPQCINYYYEDNKTEKLNKCIHDRVNDKLGQIGKSFEGGMIVVKKQSTQGAVVTTHQGAVVTTHQGAVATHQGAVTTHQGAVTTHQGAVVTTHQGAVTTHQGAVATHQGAVATHQGAVATHQGAVATVEHQQQNITSDINIMCNSLQQNYVKFNTPNTEPRVLDKARQAYEKCKKEQEELRQESK